MNASDVARLRCRGSSEHFSFLPVALLGGVGLKRVEHSHRILLLGHKNEKELTQCAL